MDSEADEVIGAEYGDQEYCPEVPLNDARLRPGPQYPNKHIPLTFV